ncbi:50S ribosomal protein L22 [Candidatus Babeliales bacterium]|nr:50S ribosomal protein L22 [Candidatus Babeliales bacterium]
MQFRAKSKFVRVSPLKLRPVASVVRGYDVERALGWLKTCPMAKRVRPIEKVLLSAFSNAREKEQSLTMRDLIVKEFRVDGGPSIHYYKPTAMGRAAVLRKRLSHLEVVLEKIAKKEDKAINAKS